MRFSHQEGESWGRLQVITHGVSPTGWMSLSKAWLPLPLLEDILIQKTNFFLSFTPRSPLSKSSPRARPIDHRQRAHPGSFRNILFERRSWWETGEQSLATETWLPGLPPIPSKLPLMWIWKWHLLNAGSMELRNDFCKTNKVEDVAGIEMFRIQEGKTTHTTTTWGTCWKNTGPPVSLQTY